MPGVCAFSSNSFDTHSALSLLLMIHSGWWKVSLCTITVAYAIIIFILLSSELKQNKESHTMMFFKIIP
jgi:hypothetical protein